MRRDSLVDLFRVGLTCVYAYTITMQKLELTVIAKTWTGAKVILASVGIDEKSKINYREIPNLYVVSVEKAIILTDDEYKSIRQEPSLSIVSDSESRKRTSEVLDKVYDVETQLRKLLLHVTDLVEIDILRNKYTQDYADKKAISVAGKLDPITSHLTLGQMKDILGTDLSWSQKILTAQDVGNILDDATDFEQFKTKLGEQLKRKTVWDVIAKNLLHSTKEWDEVKGYLNKLKDFRDQSAHYQIMTEQEKTKLIEKSEILLRLTLPPERKLTRVESVNLSSMADALAAIAKQVQAITLPADYYQKLLSINLSVAESFKVVTPNVDALVKAVQPTIDFNSKIMESYASLFAAHKIQWNLSADNNRKDEKNKT